jgi:predicted ester cyclase
MSTTSYDLSTLHARREAVVRAHIEAEAVRHDVAATLATFKHAQYDVPALGGVVDGATGVDGLLHALFAAYPDFWLRECTHYHAENAVIVECVFGGTQQGDWGGISPTGRKMEVAAALFFLFDSTDGLLCERVYFDQATVLRQLGAIQ